MIRKKQKKDAAALTLQRKTLSGFRKDRREAVFLYELFFCLHQSLMWMTMVATTIGLADVSNYCLRIFMLGPERRD
jgi:hypothetical protein